MSKSEKAIAARDRVFNLAIACGWSIGLIAKVFDCPTSTVQLGGRYAKSRSEKAKAARDGEAGRDGTLFGLGNGTGGADERRGDGGADQAGLDGPEGMAAGTRPAPDVDGGAGGGAVGDRPRKSTKSLAVVGVLDLYRYYGIPRQISPPSSTRRAHRATKSCVSGDGPQAGEPVGDHGEAGPAPLTKKQIKRQEIEARRAERIAKTKAGIQIRLARLREREERKQAEAAAIRQRNEERQREKEAASVGWLNTPQIAERLGLDVDVVRRAIHETGRKTQSSYGGFEFVYCWHFADFIAERLGLPRVFSNRMSDERVAFRVIDPAEYVGNSPARLNYNTRARAS